jgi:two-component system cell cycle response regulator
MIRIADEVASRLIRSLSTLLRKPLSLIDGDIRADVPLLDEEHAVVRDVVELVHATSATEDLEARIAQLQHENIDLIMKNRVLAEVSARDSLTGLYNRWYVMEKIESEMNRSLRHGSPVALLMLDIDHFKRINDSFGHAAGDSVLKSFGQVLRESCRVYDVPGRYGGEEFCVVLPETRIGNTTAVAERIRQRLAESRFDVGGDHVAITASMGIAGMDSVADEGLVSSAALIERADRALYSAKHRGRDRIEVWATGLASETNH